MRTLIGILVLCAVYPARAASAQPAAPPAWVVIVHPGNPVSRLDRKFVADVFLGKKTRWRGDKVVRAVDHGPRSVVRRKFTEDVLGRPLAAVRSYWNQLLFSGRGLPPPELAGDAEVIAYVKRNPGAIGYVSGAAVLDGVRVVQVR
jgi:ABC-type phosphate transport system substrate-binding protein